MCNLLGQTKTSPILSHHHTTWSPWDILTPQTLYTFNYQSTLYTCMTQLAMGYKTKTTNWVNKVSKWVYLCTTQLKQWFTKHRDLTGQVTISWVTNWTVQMMAWIVCQWEILQLHTQQTAGRIKCILHAHVLTQQYTAQSATHLAFV